MATVLLFRMTESVVTIGGAMAKVVKVDSALYVVLKLVEMV